MKKLLFLSILCAPLIVDAQERLSRAYIGAMVHDGELGGSLTNSFGINEFFGIGAGVDVTSYNSDLLVPVYLDVRLKYPVNNFAPFFFGQGGKPLYKKEDAISFTDMTGAAVKAKETGNIFFGGGAGVSYKLAKVGIFLSYTYRSYKFNYTISRGEWPSGMEDSYTKGVSIINAGLVF